MQEVNQQEAFQRGRRMAEEMGRNGIEALVDDEDKNYHGGGRSLRYSILFGRQKNAIIAPI